MRCDYIERKDLDIAQEAKKVLSVQMSTIGI